MIKTWILSKKECFTKYLPTTCTRIFFSIIRVSFRLQVLKSKALFASWVLEGMGREGKTYGEVNPCLRVLKKLGKVLMGFEGLHLSNFKVLSNWGVLGG